MFYLVILYYVLYFNEFFLTYKMNNLCRYIFILCTNNNFVTLYFKIVSSFVFPSTKTVSIKLQIVLEIEF